MQIKLVKKYELKKKDQIEAALFKKLEMQSRIETKVARKEEKNKIEQNKAKLEQLIYNSCKFFKFCFL
jgi:hypothetical protein